MNAVLTVLLLAAASTVALTSGCAAALGDAATPAPVVESPYVSQLDAPESNALFHFGRAQLLLGEGDVQGAVEDLQSAIEIDPETEELRFFLAQIYGELGRVKEARRTVEDVLIRNPASVKAHQVLGNIALGSGEPAVAVEHFRKVMEIDPDNEVVPLKLSIALIRLGEAGAAIEELKRLIADQPDSRAGRLTLARLYRDMDLNVLAEEQYRYLIEELDGAGQAYLDLGYMYEEQREFDRALQLFEEALHDNPHNLALRHHIARIYVGMKRYEEALNQLQQIVALDETDLEAWRKIGLIYMEQERWDDAVALFHDLLERDPGLDPARYYLGLALEHQQQWQKAFDAFDAIPETSALYADAVAHMGFLLMQMERLEEAVALLERQIEEGRDRPQIYYYLASIHLAENRLNDALTVLKEATAQYPEQTDLLYQQGITLEKIGRHDQAIEVMQRVIELDDNHAEAMNFIAYAYAENDTRLDTALDLARRALARKPAAHIHDTLGWVLFRLERFEEAREAIAAASRQLPDDEVVLAHLAEVTLNLGEFDKVREICQRLLELDPDNTFAHDMLERLDAAQ